MRVALFWNCQVGNNWIIATLGSNLDFESKLCSEEPEWVIKSLLTKASNASGVSLPTKVLEMQAV